MTNKPRTRSKKAIRYLNSGLHNLTRIEQTKWMHAGRRYIKQIW